MLGFRSGATAAAPPNLSIQRNFAAVFAGNAVFAAAQWASLSLVARLGGGEMLGQYALAVAIVSPVALFAHLNLRAVLATDIQRAHPFGDYMAVRMGTTAAGLAVILGLALLSGHGWPVAPAIVLAGVVLSADHFSDICYGALQRRERMDQVARSTVARGALALAAMGAALWITHSLLWALAAQAAARIGVFLIYDRPAAAVHESPHRSGFAAQAAILRAALPLGVVLMLLTLSGNLPRYAIERHMGTVALGVFAAVASFQTIGASVINPLGQTMTPRLARAFSQGNAPLFLRLAARLTGAACLLGAAGVAVALTAGRLALGVAYGPAFANYGGLLVWMMAAGILGYAGSALGYVITAARAFDSQAPLFLAVALVSAAASWVLVPKLGLEGAALALALAWLAQIAGELLILRRALRRGERRP
jgi:O-antigen/teichoic acid export membrane protein